MGILSIRRLRVLVCALAACLAAAPALAGEVDYGGYRPHYQGYGVDTPGGRGGWVCRVTSLSDADLPAKAGTLRYCLGASGARFVIFEISGTVRLVHGPLMVTNPYITIAGQTAPSPGILVRGQGIIIDTHDVVMQHIRVRVGNVPNQPLGIWMRNDARNVVIDHVSVSWTVWTAVAVAAYSAGHHPTDITIIDSIISEPLACSGVNTAIPCNPATYFSGQYSNSRGFGISDGWNDQQMFRVAEVRTLEANVNDRFPEIGGWTQTFLVNNLLYNPSLTPRSGIYFEGTNGGAATSVIKSNVLIAGPTTPGNNGYVPKEFVEEGDVKMVRIHPTTNSASRIYLDGNYYAKDCGGTACLANPSAQWMLAKDFKMDWQGVNVRAMTPPLSLDNLPLFSAMPYDQVESFVTANAGARPLDRDAVDARIVREVKTGTGSVPNNTAEKAGPGTASDGFPILAINTRPLTVPANPNEVMDAVGRTRIEYWLEDFARQLEPMFANSQLSAPKNLHTVVQ